MAVPNTNSFTQQDVRNEIENNGGAVTNSLGAAFTNATGTFDSNYQGTKDRLSNFRNYEHNVQWLISSSTFNDSVDLANLSSPIPIFDLRDFFVKRTGTDLYVIRNRGGGIYQFKMQTPHDLATLSYEGVGYVETSILAEALHFSSDGLRVFVLDYQNILYEHSLSIAWDIATLSNTPTQTAVLTTSTTISSRDIYFNTTGTEMYWSIVENSNSAVQKYNLSSAWGISTLNPVGTYPTTLGTTGDIESLNITNDEKDFITSSSSRLMKQYTALSNASYVDEGGLNSVLADFTGNDRFYTLGTYGSEIKQYNTNNTNI